MPLVSVIMGVYNCKDKKMLEESVDSICNQTFKDWEFIICDDGSTDDTLDFLRSMEKKDSRIRIITYAENKGLAYALNECIKVSRGDYIARQDDDDYSLPYRLERQIEFLKTNKNISFVGSNAYVYDSSGVWGEYNVKEKPLKESFLWTNPFAHPTVVFVKSALIESNCYRVSKETRRCEDYDLFMRMYSLGFYGYNIQEKLYKYRIVNDNHKYRPMKYRIEEAIIRWHGYGLLKINVLLRLIFSVKPILIGLIPQRLFRVIRRNQY